MPRILRDHNNSDIKIQRKGDPLPELVVILRTELHKILADCATEAGVGIITKSRILAATAEGQLETTSGFGARANLVVGADGVFSRIRDSLRLTKHIIDLKDGCGRHLIPRLEGDLINRTEVWNGGRRIGIAPVSDDQHYVFLCCPASDIQGRMQQPFNLEAWVDSHPWYADYLNRLPRHPQEYWRPFFNVACTSWSRGHVAIVGDAAHGMAPNLGQGACTAIANALVLARIVTDDKDIPRALKRWEKSERPYIDLTQRNSYLYGAVGTKWPRPLLGLRSKILPYVGKTNTFQKNMRCAIDHVSSI